MAMQEVDRIGDFKKSVDEEQQRAARLKEEEKNKMAKIEHLKQEIEEAKRKAEEAHELPEETELRELDKKHEDLEKKKEEIEEKLDAHKKY